MKCTLITIFLCFVIGTPVWADFLEGKAAFDRGDYAAALREFNPFAEQGNAEAQSYLGFMYATGKGVPQDFAEAVRWWRKAAEQGNVIGQGSLGNAYLLGNGVRQDFAEAVRWWRKAAEQGHPPAQSNLGFAYFRGDGVPRDYIEAHKWLNLAAAQGNKKAHKKLNTVTKRMTQAQLAIAQRLARLWRPKKHISRMPIGELCRFALTGSDKPLDWSRAYVFAPHVVEAKRRNLTVSKCDEERSFAYAELANGSQRPTYRNTRELQPPTLDTAPPPSPITAAPTPRVSLPKPRAQDTTLIRQRIARIQRQLASLGYDPGPADGITGPKTRAAIRTFEVREGLPVTGTISQSLEAALRSARPVLARKTPQVPRPPPGPRSLKKASTGSGFIASSVGHILTNEHVVKKCLEVRVAGAGNVGLIARDENVDLALLKSNPRHRNTATFRGGRGIRTGDDIIVAGYPLQGLLSTELNVTKGIVSNVTGPGDDRRIIQISAPVQSGNSGGPVLDTSGHVVGVVMAKLNAIRIARVTGILPENVNFAVSEGTARAFLDSHDVPYETARSNKPKPTADIAAKAKGYTVLIECWK